MHTDLIGDLLLYSCGVLIAYVYLKILKIFLDAGEEARKRRNI